MAQPPQTGSDPYRRGLFSFVLAAVAVGLFVRFWQLGGAPLAVDEYYFGNSILNIVTRGVPQFPCGGYYTRGLLIQYMSAPLIYFGASLELAGRIWPAIASSFSIIAVWKIARLAAGTTVASVAVILCSLSLWEIEFARFGRMYAPFQMLVLWYLYFQMLHLVQGKEYARWAYLGLSLLAIFVYQGAALLLALNFLVIVWPGKRWNIKHLLSAFLLLLVGFVDQLVDFRHLGVPSSQLPPLPDGVSSNTFPIDLPMLPVSPLVAATVTLILLGCTLWMYRTKIRIVHPSFAYWIFVLFCFCLGLAGLGIGLTLAGFLMQLPLPVVRNENRRLNLPAALAGLTLAWLIAVFLLHSLAREPLRASVKATLDFVLGFPDIYYKVLLPWMQAIPFTTILIGVLLLYCLWDLFKHADSAGNSRNFLRYLFSVTILLVILVGLLEQPYRTTRYTYFLYPVMLILASAGLVALSSRFGSEPGKRVFSIALFMGVLFGFAEDFRISHLIQINEAQYRYRTAYSGRTVSHYYTRWDYRGTAEFINAHLEPTDKVIVFDQPAAHYLQQTDGVFLRSGTQIHRLTWACGGDRHLWSNARLLDQDSEVDSLLEGAAGSVWFIARGPEVRSRDRLEVALMERFNLRPLYTSIDGHLLVYRIDHTE